MLYFYIISCNDHKSPENNNVYSSFRYKNRFREVNNLKLYEGKVPGTEESFT